MIDFQLSIGFSGISLQGGTEYHVYTISKSFNQPEFILYIDPKLAIESKDEHQFPLLQEAIQAAENHYSTRLKEWTPPSFLLAKIMEHEKLKILTEEEASDLIKFIFRKLQVKNQPLQGYGHEH